MPDQTIAIHHFTNGLTLVTEVMPAVQSAAFSFLVPGGAVFDPAGENGTASILSDMITRGAGDRDTRELSEALDNLGLHRSESAGTEHLSISGATLADNIPDALRLYADILRRPLLPPDQFEAARSGVEQTLRGNEDEPRQRIMTDLKERCLPTPWGRPTDGKLDDLPAITAASVRNHYERCLRPNGAILGVAGNVDPAEMTDLIGELFGDWAEKPALPIETGNQGTPREHIEHDSAQTHIGLAYPSVPYRDPDYFTAWAAVGILSGGMSARLFTEVREKRGLCYAISAALTTLKDHARVLGYAGTTNERAQHTLDAMLLSILWLSNGVAEDELERCKARAKSSLIMQQESTIARSAAVARDWYHLGRVVTLDEVKQKVEAITVPAVMDFVHTHPPRDLTILTIGPKALEVPAEILRN